MKKKYTLEALQGDAFRLMQAHGKRPIYATVDGNFFFDKNAMDNHNATLSEDGEIPKPFVFDLPSEAEVNAIVQAEKEEAEAAAAEKLAAEAKAKEEAEAAAAEKEAEAKKEPEKLAAEAKAKAPKKVK